jgi:transcriptional regulator with PAS, ATPase and Fis domain
MDKAQKIEAGAIRLPEMSVAPRIGRASEPAEKLIETLTDQVCDQVTESLEAVLKAIERRIISRVLKKTGGNRTQAAKLLGIKPTTLSYKLKKLKIAID